MSTESLNSQPSGNGDSTPGSQVAPDATEQTAATLAPPELNVEGMEALPPEFLPPQSVAGYTLPPPDDSPEAQAADFEARGWMLHAGLPGSVGSYIAQEVSRLDDPTGGDDASFELGRTTLVAQMERMYGPESTAKKLADVQWLVEHVDRKSGGRLGDWLEQNAGVLLNLQVIGQLAAHAERMRGRLR